MNKALIPKVNCAIHCRPSVISDRFIFVSEQPQGELLIHCLIDLFTNVGMTSCSNNNLLLSPRKDNSLIKNDTKY